MATSCKYQVFTWDVDGYIATLELMVEASADPAINGHGDLPVVSSLENGGTYEDCNECLYCIRRSRRVVSFR